jgi:hypothetical protein
MCFPVSRPLECELGVRHGRQCDERKHARDARERDDDALEPALLVRHRLRSEQRKVMPKSLARRESALAHLFDLPHTLLGPVVSGLDVLFDGVHCLGLLRHKPRQVAEHLVDLVHIRVQATHGFGPISRLGNRVSQSARGPRGAGNNAQQRVFRIWNPDSPRN